MKRAERKFITSTLTPDVDNATVGKGTVAIYSAGNAHQVFPAILLPVIKIFKTEELIMPGTMLENVREKTPLVHSIINYVTINDCANVLLACGGISQQNILQLRNTGIAGVAIVSSLFAHPDIRATAKTLRELGAEVVRP